jgi:hypothetical protein
MKSRPRSIERKVADHLNEFFSDVGMSPVMRIPILGRTGPDIEINEANWVIDVKSRKAVPMGTFVLNSEHAVTYANGMTAFPLESLKTLTDKPGHYFRYPSLKGFKSVRDWYDHMNEWTLEHKPEGINMLVLHKPGMPVGKSSVIISTRDWSKLWKQLLLLRSHQA